MLFDDAKLVFHLCPDSGHVPVPGALFIGQRLVAATVGLCEVLCAWRAIGNGFFLAGIGGIAPHPGFLPMKYQAATGNRARWTTKSGYTVAPVVSVQT